MHKDIEELIKITNAKTYSLHGKFTNHMLNMLNEKIISDGFELVEIASNRVLSQKYIKNKNGIIEETGWIGVIDNSSSDNLYVVGSAFGKFRSEIELLHSRLIGFYNATHELESLLYKIKDDINSKTII